jgi:hypothetical protein
MKTKTKTNTNTNTNTNTITNTDTKTITTITKMHGRTTTNMGLTPPRHIVHPMQSPQETRDITKGSTEANLVWQERKSGGQLFIGTDLSSRDRGMLEEHNISRIVNCSEMSRRNEFEQEQWCAYSSFNCDPVMPGPHHQPPSQEANVLAFWEPLFVWIDTAVAAGCVAPFWHLLSIDDEDFIADTVSSFRLLVAWDAWDA